MSKTVQFVNVRKGLDTIDDAFNKLAKDYDFESLSEFEQLVIINPMAYLATMFDMDNEDWSKDLMYNLMVRYKPWEEIKK